MNRWTYITTILSAALSIIGAMLAANYALAELPTSRATAYLLGITISLVTIAYWTLHRTRKATKEDSARAGRQEAEQAPRARRQPAAPKVDVYQEIRKLAGLRDEGLITSEEFESKKRDLLNRL